MSHHCRIRFLEDLEELLANIQSTATQHQSIARDFLDSRLRLWITQGFHWIYIGCLFSLLRTLPINDATPASCRAFCFLASSLVLKLSATAEDLAPKARWQVPKPPERMKVEQNNIQGYTKSKLFPGFSLVDMKKIQARINVVSSPSFKTRCSCPILASLTPLRPGRKWRGQKIFWASARVEQVNS